MRLRTDRMHPTTEFPARRSVAVQRESRPAHWLLNSDLLIENRSVFVSQDLPLGVIISRNEIHFFTENKEEETHTHKKRHGFGLNESIHFLGILHAKLHPRVATDQFSNFVKEGMCHRLLRCRAQLRANSRRSPSLDGRTGAAATAGPARQECTSPGFAN